MLCTSRRERQERQDYSATQPSKDVAFVLTATRLLNAEKCSRFAIDVLCFKKNEVKVPKKIRRIKVPGPRNLEQFSHCASARRRCRASSLAYSLPVKGTCCLLLVPALLVHSARRSSSFLDHVGGDDAFVCALVHDAHAADCWLRVAPPLCAQFWRKNL